MSLNTEMSKLSNKAKAELAALKSDLAQARADLRETETAVLSEAESPSPIDGIKWEWVAVGVVGVGIALGVLLYWLV